MALRCTAAGVGAGLGRGALAAAIVATACVVSDVDLRQPSPPAGDSSCAWRDRFDEAAGVCLPCQYRLPHPFDGCPCAWTYRPAPAPFCDAPEAYYECLPCTGSIDSCNAYERATEASRDCALLARCCGELQATAGATPCCGSSESLACVFDPAASQGASLFRVGCLPEPCCVGGPCPNGQGDCLAWQSCAAGICAPACELGVQECQVVLDQGGLDCMCVDVVTPP